MSFREESEGDKSAFSYFAKMINRKSKPTIEDFFADDEVKKMIQKTKCGVVTIASLKKFGGLE